MGKLLRFSGEKYNCHPTVGDARIYRLCLVIGHHYDPDEMEYTSVYHCHRCGYWGDYDTGFPCWVRETCYRLKYRLWTRWTTPLRWWLKCPGCGGRFGRCDPNYDHIPF